MARPRKKLKRQGKVTTDNQQVNVVALKKKLKWNKELSSILMLLKVNLNPTPILENKFVVIDDTFHMIGFKRVRCNTLQIKNPNPNPKPHLHSLFENGDGIFFCPNFSKQYLHCLKVLIARLFVMPSLYLVFICLFVIPSYF
jgi:hypothetical protein